MTHAQKEEWFINYNYLMMHRNTEMTDEKYQEDFARLRDHYFDKPIFEREELDKKYESEHQKLVDSI